MFEKFTSRRTPEKDQRNSNDRPMAVSSGHHAPKKAPGSSTLTSGDKYSLPSRPQFTNVETMEFWKRIFPDAMNKFRSSHPQSKPPPAEYDIRNKQDWQSIYQVLEKARAHYQSRGGTLGDLRFHLRNVADSIAPAAAVARTATQIVLPLQDPILSPVLQAVVILLDAAKMSSVVRQQALQGLGNLTPCFADIEIFLQLFPGDTNILNASLNLTVVVLDTIERGIAFFMSAQIARIAKAAAFGDYYGEGLVKGLDLINEQCSNLLREANKSKDYQVHLASRNMAKVLSQPPIGTTESTRPALESLQVTIESLTGKGLQIEKSRQDARPTERDLVRAIEKCVTALINEKDRELKRKDEELLAMKQQVLLLRSSMSPSQHGMPQPGYSQPSSTRPKPQLHAPPVGVRY